MRTPRKKKLRITKVEGAVRQIDAAIAAFEDGRFDVVVTLTGAAEGMLPQGEKSIFSRLVEKGPKDKAERTKWIGEINHARNWLKHQSDATDTLELTYKEAYFAVARAMSHVPADAWSPAMEAFRLWISRTQFRGRASATVKKSR